MNEEFQYTGKPPKPAKPGKPDPYIANDGKHYWHGWTGAYSVRHGGHTTHAFCEEERTGKSLCGVAIAEGSGLSIPNETVPCCMKCMKNLEKRGIKKGDLYTILPCPKRGLSVNNFFRVTSCRLRPKCMKTHFNFSWRFIRFGIRNFNGKMELFKGQIDQGGGFVIIFRCYADESAFAGFEAININGIVAKMAQHIDSFSFWESAFDMLILENQFINKFNSSGGIK